jgi:hypothetical protein
MIPTETEEQIALVQHLELKGYKFTAIPNSTFTRSWKQKNHNKAVGLRAGFPDLVVIAGDKFMAIELKRTKGGVVSLEQKAWVEALEQAGIPVAVCKGAEQAIKFIEGKVNESSN